MSGTSLPCKKVYIFGVFVLLLCQLAACQNKPTPVATVTPLITPFEIATRAAEAMLSVDSLHFSIERDGALVYIDTEQLLAFKRAEGDFGLPDRMRAVVRVITAFTPIDIGMVILGDDQYATDPITGKWGQLPIEWGQFNLTVLFDPEMGLQSLLKDGIIDLRLVGSEEIEGQTYYRLAGRASGDRMSAMTLGFIGNGDVELEVWIDTRDFYLHRLRIVEGETDPSDPTTWLMRFSNMGQPVEIVAPPASSGYLAPGYINNGIVQTVSAGWW